VTFARPADACVVTPNGSCFTDGPSNYGNNERCTVTVLQPTFLTVYNLSIDAGFDYFSASLLGLSDTDDDRDDGYRNDEIAARSRRQVTRITTAAEFEGLMMIRGSTITWQSDFTDTSAGFTICVRN
jgi:hypothetical protein